MGMQALALLLSACVAVLGGWMLMKRQLAGTAGVLLALPVGWWWFNGGLPASVQVLHSSAGLLLLAAAGLCLACRSWLAAGGLLASVGVVWVGSYYRMSIPEWVAGGNQERLYWFQLLGDVTAWGLVAVGVAVLFAVWSLAQRIKV